MSQKGLICAKISSWIKETTKMLTIFLMTPCLEQILSANLSSLSMLYSWCCPQSFEGNAANEVIMK